MSEPICCQLLPFFLNIFTFPEWELLVLPGEPIARTLPSFEIDTFAPDQSPAAPPLISDPIFIQVRLKPQQFSEIFV